MSSHSSNKACGSCPSERSIAADGHDATGSAGDVVSGTSTDADGGLEIINLPEIILSSISSYLPNDETRILLAVALTAPSSSFRKRHWKIPTSSARDSILQCNLREGPSLGGGNEQWTILDFGIFEEITVGLGRLSDEDLGSILTCIGARDSLKTLKLRNNHGIDGSGLEPLKHSTTLMQIDLSFGFKNDCSYINTISSSIGISILNSIIEQEGNSLQHVHMPKEWRLKKNQLLDQFIAKYNKLLSGRSMLCCNVDCRNICEGGVHRSGKHYGIQGTTCYKCMNHSCGCESIECCHVCSRVSCGDCKVVRKCTRGRMCDDSSPACLECGGWVFPLCCADLPLCKRHVYITPCCKKPYCSIERVNCCEEFWSQRGWGR